jgi:hypothetical protein
VLFVVPGFIEDGGVDGGVEVEGGVVEGGVEIEGGEVEVEVEGEGGVDPGTKSVDLTTVTKPSDRVVIPSFPDVKK